MKSTVPNVGPVFAAALTLSLCVLMPNGTAMASNAGPLRAGAASVDITPRKDHIPKDEFILDRLYVRALVISNDRTCAVLVGMDQGISQNDVISAATKGIVTATGCPESQIVISATHTHSGSTVFGPGGYPHADRVAAAVVQAATEAKGRLRPARIGFGAAKVDLNVNRDYFTHGQWLQGPNEEGVSDKTLAVMEVLDTAGQPIAVYMNYAMHPIAFFLSGAISPAFPGAASRYIEGQYPGSVAIFVQGASGNQNPNLLAPMQHLLAVRTGQPWWNDTRITAPAPWLDEAREHNAVTDMFTAVNSPVPQERRAAYEAAIKVEHELDTAQGVILGQTALNTMLYDIPVLQSDAVIAGARTSFECPGRDRLDAKNPVRQGRRPPYADGAPVVIKEGVLRLGNTYIDWVDGEVYGEIALRLKREAPVNDLMVTTLANGAANSGYIYSNDSDAHLTFQVIGSRLKPGCAEPRIVDTGLQLISRLGN
jgi:Neutral/alkaline non-lysosomal ceramidase, N-terminal